MEFLINAQYRIALPGEKFVDNLIHQIEPPLSPMINGANALYGPKDDWCSHIILDRSYAHFILYMTDSAYRSMWSLNNGTGLDWYFITEDGKHYRTKQPIKFNKQAFTGGVISQKQGARARYFVKNYRRYFDI